MTCSRLRQPTVSVVGRRRPSWAEYFAMTHGSARTWLKRYWTVKRTSSEGPSLRTRLIGRSPDPAPWPRRAPSGRAKPKRPSRGSCGASRVPRELLEELRRPVVERLRDLRGQALPSSPLRGRVPRDDLAAPVLDRLDLGAPRRDPDQDDPDERTDGANLDRARGVHEGRLAVLLSRRPRFAPWSASGLRRLDGRALDERRACSGDLLGEGPERR